jgi:hypothetical protein
MWRLGRSRAVAESRRAWAVLLLTGPALIWSCGGASENGSGNPGVAGSPSGGASSVAGAAGSKQGGSTAGGSPGHGGASGGTAHAGEAQGAGAGQATGGAASAGGAASTQAGASVGGSAAGAAGASEHWDPELLGFDCDSKRCSVGQACIRCFVNGTSSRICVPSPTAAPAGFAAATESCEKPLTAIFDECDGPEDCAAAQYCVAAEGTNGFMRCREQPSIGGSCCFACGALTDCTLCRSAADCPNNAACQPAQSAPPGIMGCQRG